MTKRDYPSTSRLTVRCDRCGKTATHVGVRRADLDRVEQEMIAEHMREGCQK